MAMGTGEDVMVLVQPGYPTYFNFMSWFILMALALIVLLCCKITEQKLILIC